MTEDSRPARRRQTWAIGMYSGPSSLELRPEPRVTNPVLTAGDVADVVVEFVADPFMVRSGGLWYLFFEAFRDEGRKGVVALATSPDARRWDYRGVVLEEPFHLSYPHVLQVGHDYYMTPETLALGGVALYRAEPFPTRWRRCGMLTAGELCDPTPFRHAGRWWLFAGKPGRPSDSLKLFHAEALIGPWLEHPRSPVVKGDARRARPAGRVVRSGGRLYRFAQDCVPHYGSAVRAFEIVELTGTDYEERPATPEVVVAPGAEGWNSGRVHHVDAHEVARGRWVACVDGSLPVE